MADGEGCGGGGASRDRDLGRVSARVLLHLRSAIRERGRHVRRWRDD